MRDTHPPGHEPKWERPITAPPFGTSIGRRRLGFVYHHIGRQWGVAALGSSAALQQGSDTTNRLAIRPPGRFPLAVQVAVMAPLGESAHPKGQATVCDACLGVLGFWLKRVPTGPMCVPLRTNGHPALLPSGRYNPLLVTGAGDGQDSCPFLIPPHRCLLAAPA